MSATTSATIILWRKNLISGNTRLMGSLVEIYQEGKNIKSYFHEPFTCVEIQLWAVHDLCWVIEPWTRHGRSQGVPIHSKHTCDLTCKVTTPKTDLHTWYTSNGTLNKNVHQQPQTSNISATPQWIPYSGRTSCSQHHWVYSITCRLSYVLCSGSDRSQQDFYSRSSVHPA